MHAFFVWFLLDLHFEKEARVGLQGEYWCQYTQTIPKQSMYGVFTYIGVVSGVSMYR